MSVSIEDLTGSIWRNVVSFLYPFEQCTILVLSSYFNDLNKNNVINIPQHNFLFDMNYWKNNFDNYADFGFADINVKDKLTTLNLSNSIFNILSNQQKKQLLYYLKYHSKLAKLYQINVEKILDKDIDNYAALFYKQIKYLYCLDVGDNCDKFGVNGIKYVIKYLESVTDSASLLKEINLNNNNIDDNSLLLLLNTINNKLNKWNNLRRIDLSDNVHITDKYMELLIKNICIDKCNGFDYLNLESTSIGDKTCNIIYDICEKYPNKVYIKHINLQFNDNITNDMEEKLTNNEFKKKFPIIAKGMKITI